MRRLVLPAALAALFALPLAAAAQTATGRWGSVDLGAHTYRPNIDSDFATSPGPYEESFGTGRGWMFELGVSRALYTGFGSLEAGLRSGYFQDVGHGIVTGSSPPVYSVDETKFKIIPTSLALTYRADFIPDRFHVPLAPYVRATLDRYNWWVTGGGGGQTERGATNGWSVTGGIGFLLDFIDPGMARELDRESGVNHTYVVFEVTQSHIDDFGSSSSWDLSSEKLTLGGALLFVF